MGETTEDCQLSSSLVEGLSFKLINSSYVNHTIICTDNIAKFGSAQGNSEKNVNICNYLQRKCILSIKLLPAARLRSITKHF